jgi:hypothetical protein
MTFILVQRNPNKHWMTLLQNLQMSWAGENRISIFTKTRY